MFEPEVCSNLLRLICGDKKRSEEIEFMTESFCRGRKQRLSEVGPNSVGASRRMCGGDGTGVDCPHLPL